MPDINMPDLNNNVPADYQPVLENEKHFFI